VVSRSVAIAAGGGAVGGGGGGGAVGAVGAGSALRPRQSAI
jgi:hypothetical protein